jgi:glycosyltransferase involved in cell wall biosynthesis
LPVEAARLRLDLLHSTVNVRPILCSCPTIVTVHDVIFLRYPQAFKPSKRRYLSAMTGWSCRHAAQVIAVSEQTRRDIIELFGVAPDRVTTVHNGVGEKFRSLPANEVGAFKKAKGLDGKRMVLYLGTLEPRKNIPTLIGAFASLAKSNQYDDCVLAIGGSKGWYYDEIFASAERLGLVKSGKVRFLGRVPDEELTLWYNSAAAFTYPSLYEGFGLPVLEAMACGTPVIAANTSAFPEVVGEAGLLVDPTDEAAWCRALMTVLNDSELHSKLSTLGLEQAAKFSWQKAAEETARVYDRVLARTRNGK